MNLPQTAAAPVFVVRPRTHERPREHGRHVVAAVGALLVHLFCLFAFILGPAYEVKSPPEPKLEVLQVRLIEPPEPPPPPPVRGTPPKELGPRHQGRSSQPAPSSEPSAYTQAAVTAAPAPATATPVLAKVTTPHAPTPKPVAAPPPPVSLPKPAPTPELQPIPLAGEPPPVVLPTPTMQPPVPPKFQPESVRKPQLEGNQPMLPPASLALPEVPPQSLTPISVSSIALNTEVPKITAPASVVPARAEMAAAPPVPELQPIPLPAQPSPSVNLQTSLSVPTPTVPNEKPQVQAPTIEVAEAELEAVPVAPATPARTEAPAPSVKIEMADTARTPAIQPSIERPQLSAPAAIAAAPTPATITPSKPAQSPAPATTEQPAAQETSASPADLNSGRDVSSAPDATPQGSDTAAPGEPNSVVAAPEASTGKNTTAASPKTGQGSDKGSAAKQQGSGQPGGNQPGADQGEKHGELGDYVQLKPRGDTSIMSHGTPNIGYKPTRFDQDWTPEGESSIDTALRHAVEKTTVKHTFHLPRGVRIECAVMPLLPMSLLGCKNPDPPPKPVDAKVYERLHLAPANPVASPALAPAASSTTPAPMVKFDNSAECAAARVTGGPPPPGCEGIVLPVKPAGTPASSSSSWVPASDQFH